MSIEKAAEMATDWWAERLMSGDVDKFKKTLRPLIEERLKASGHCYLECDYDPFEPLLTAVRASGHDDCRGYLFSASGILPKKHSLDVHIDHMHPKTGYGQYGDTILVKS